MVQSFSGQPVFLYHSCIHARATFYLARDLMLFSLLILTKLEPRIFDCFLGVTTYQLPKENSSRHSKVLEEAGVGLHNSLPPAVCIFFWQGAELAKVCSWSIA